VKIPLCVGAVLCHKGIKEGRATSEKMKVRPEKREGEAGIGGAYISLESEGHRSYIGK